MQDRLSNLPQPGPQDWPDSWRLPPHDTPFDTVKVRHEKMVQEALASGWRAPRNEAEENAASDLAEELLRRHLPDYAANDVEGYGAQRSKALYHHVLYMDGRGRKNEADDGFSCQLLLEVRDRQGHWVGLDADGAPVAFTNAICMHVRGTDQGVEYLALHYSDPALTESLFATDGDFAKLPRHIAHEIKSGIDIIAAGRAKPDLGVAEVDWRTREVRLPASDGSYTAFLSLNETGLVAIRLMFTAKQQ